jgi:hypothetical protein
MQTSQKLIVGLVVFGGGALALALRSGFVESSHHTAADTAPHAQAAHAAQQAPASPALLSSVAKARSLAQPEARRDSLVQALAEAAEREPGSTARLAAALTVAEGRDEALLEAVGHYLRAEPATARVWLDELLAREDAELSFVLARAAGRHDPSLAVVLSGKVHEHLRGPFLQELFANWGGSDPRAASAVAGKLDNPKDQRAAASGLSSTWAQSEPAAAWAWATALPADGVRRPALEALVTAWSEHDPGAAARAAIEAQSSSRQRLIDTAVSAWVQRDADAVFGWLEDVQDTDAREGAATAALITLSQSDPDAAAAHAATWAQREQSEASSAVLDKVLAWQRSQGAR